jgi:hypothetical protein
VTLSDHQWEFLQDLALLILWAKRRGYKVTGGDLYRDPRAPYGIKNSLHKQRLAVDLNLFEKREGSWVYLSSTESHRPLGEFWESLNLYNRWGGRFKDGNHYERQTSEWRT